MSSSKKWVNQEFLAHKTRAKRIKKERYSVAKRKVRTAKEAPKLKKEEKASHENTDQLNLANPSLLESISRLSTLAQKMDLVKIRNQIAEINQIVHQVNGVINGLHHWNRQHPYSSYRPRQ